MNTTSRTSIDLPPSSSSAGTFNWDSPFNLCLSFHRKILTWLIPLGVWRYGPFGPSVFRIGPRMMVKSDVRYSEVANMQHIASNTSIPVPRVRDYFVSNGRSYLVMDYIDAPTLLGVWDTLSPLEKQSILLQLQEHLVQLRQLTPPHAGHVEAAEGLPCWDPRLRSTPFGPFTSVKDFHEFLGHDYMRTAENCREYRAVFEECARRSYKTMFTHGDLAPRNILVKDAKIVGLIDWEVSGWYPEYWEYVRLRNAFIKLLPEDFVEGLLEPMTPYPTETKAEAALSELLEGRY
ncbi:hypothetical protein Hypma_004681 [Hypsizygus marmoreus]|uniref:Aminoglycoside phosphotransferase domain-containing protein n=1 Tax=Hypsizygus marmoreus TaxID=39966 RepID=A0A369J012_HYPMA|nr:hypothetical protein Hypma_004681 [Hypsizygus marmoreus]